ncbi:YfhE family protein [Texcoconibacillus texcoconensis]|uniref:Uncharacterized protein n=1 Tax=Texcoconibacillus texcoconensis TaxID=1095777 RepID=A0A840QTL1_9BACI|nr:YfhE family protein [Texcoconibacillus texcoconensis]MBB5174638.1 hypothetical protein [Texcoconibacillus texcoconensis]
MKDKKKRRIDQNKRALKKAQEVEYSSEFAAADRVLNEKRNK